MWIPEPNTGCWLWFGSQTSAGYGNGTRDCLNFYAHRESFEDANGLGTADGWVIRHRCDTPWCVNPEHLLRGTAADNARDMDERNRRVRPQGARHARATITESTALRIRALGSSRSATEIADDLSVDRDVVYSILNGISWRHLGGKVMDRKIEDTGNPNIGQQRYNAFLSESQAKEIKNRVAAGEKGTLLAAEFGVSPATISAIKHGRIWSHA